MDEGLLAIGPAARALGTTVRALRYYEQRDLLRPSPVRTGGRRGYDAAAMRRARRLVAFRELGLALETIRGLLDNDSADELRAVLEVQAARIDENVVRLADLRARIVAIIAADIHHTDLALDLLEDISMNIGLSRIYTRTGDDGTTDLTAGRRVDKTDSRLEVMGDVDELGSAIGVAVAAPGAEGIDRLREIQNDLFDVGADLTGSRPDGARRVDDDYVQRLERACDEANATVAPSVSFVLPGSAPFPAALHLARAICRRAERHAWALADPPGEVCRYLNRLSDLLFILARAAEPEPEPTWVPSAHRPN